jgi:hypothetical protein
MSTTSNFFIEVRKDDKWHLLYALYPFEPRKIERVIDGKIETIDAKPYTTCENNVGYDRFIKFWKQGSVRDLFNNMMINSPVAKRGLPKDISEEVRTWFDEKLAEVEEEKNRYKEKYGEERPWSGKWWYSESYATLPELWKVFDKMYEEWKARTLRLVDDKWKNSVIVQRLDAIDVKIDKALGGEVKENETHEEGYYEEDIEYAFGDDLFDVMNVYAFIQTVRQFVESLTSSHWYNDENIRIVTYSD